MLQSGFEDVLHTNYVPTVEDTARILEFCAGPETEIASFDLEIRQLEGLLTDVRSKRDILASVVKSHRDLLAPIRRLSPEILQTIFAFCLPEDRNTVMHASEAPLRLRHVSKRWRDIVNNTAEMWACIHIAVPSRDGERSRALRNAAQSWLSRSGAHPLRISFYTEQPCEYAHAAKFLDVIAPYAERWRHMSFIMPPKLFRYFEQSPHTRQQLPNIHSLELRNRVGDDAFSSPSLEAQEYLNNLTDLLHLLNLTPNIIKIHLSVNDCSGLPVVSLFKPTLAQPLASKLQELTLDCMSTGTFNGRFSQLLAFLTNCHSLQKLTLCGSFPENDVARDERVPVLLPKLQYLALALLLASGPPSHGYGGPGRPVIFLDYIIAPSLLELCLIKSFNVDTELFHTTLTRFFIRSQCPLQTFMVQHYLHSNSEMALLPSCLEHVPQLRKLSIVFPYHPSSPPAGTLLPGVELEPEERLENADGLLSALRTSVECCPNLTNLVIFESGYFPSFDTPFPNYDTLLPLLRSRAENLKCTGNHQRGGKFRLDLPFGTRGVPFPSRFQQSTDQIPPEFRIAVAELEKEYPGCLQVVMPDPVIPDPPSAYAGVTSDDKESWEH